MSEYYCSARFVNGVCNKCDSLQSDIRKTRRTLKPFKDASEALRAASVVHGERIKEIRERSLQIHREIDALRTEAQRRVDELSAEHSRIQDEMWDYAFAAGLGICSGKDSNNGL